MTKFMSQTDFVNLASQAQADLRAAFRILNDLDYSMISVSQAKAIMKAMIMVAEASEKLSDPLTAIEDQWGFRDIAFEDMTEADE